ncbi:conjugal transfer protein TraO [Photorhabdus asymbiotica]|uniref:conjugal transfer protein TraO n=1 Tax=Photorhabdus asymbiotica TaxID=291112 RepID=UPI003DA77BCA
MTKKQSMKKLAIIIGTIVVIGVALGAIIISSGSDDSIMAANSKVVNKRTSLTTDSNNDDESYRQLMQEYNEINSQKALASGASFVGTASGKEVTAPDDQAQKYEWEKDSKPTPNNNPQPQNSRLQEEKLKRKLALLQKIEDRRGVPDDGTIIVMANVYGGDSSGENKWSVSLYPDSNLVASQSATQANAQQEQGVQLVKGLATFPAVVDSAVNSDNKNMKMVAHIAAGKLKGAQLFSDQLSLAGNGVEVRFSTMQWNGRYYRVEAYAVETGTNEFAIASKINNHWFSRILLPALAYGIGQTGKLYKDSNSNIIVTPNGGEYRSNGSPNGEAIAGTIVGGIGEQAGKVMAEDASKLPVKQVTVDVNKVIGIQFVKPVYSTDAIQ